MSEGTILTAAWFVAGMSVGAVIAHWLDQRKWVQLGEFLEHQLADAKMESARERIARRNAMGCRREEGNEL